MDGSSKFVGELGTVSCVSGSCNSVNLKPLCDSNESLSHNFGLENSMCVADVRFDVPNLHDSVVSGCSDLHLRTGDTRPASCTLGYVLGVGDPKQTFFSLSEGIMSGTQPVCEPLPFSAPNMIQSPLWMCALTGRRREVAWFHERVDLLLWETRP